MKLSCLFSGYGMKTSQDWRGGERERERERKRERENGKRKNVYVPSCHA